MRKLGLILLVAMLGVTLLLLATFGWLRGGVNQNCESLNETKVTLHKLLDDAKPLATIRKPGETDEQYTFRQRQFAEYLLLANRRLKRAEC